MGSDQRLESFGSFSVGVASVFKGIGRVFGTKGAKRFIIIPFILNVLLLGSIIYISLYHVYPYLASYVPHGEGFVTKILFLVLGIFLKLLFIIITFFLTAFLYSIIGMAICSPFIEPVSEKIEEVVTGTKINTPFSFFGIIREIMKSIIANIWFLIFFIGFNVLLLLINFIPFIGTIIYIPLGTMSFLFFIGYQMFDSIFARKGYNFSKKLGTLWKIKWSVMGIGFGFVILTYIPLAGFLSPIFAAAGATEMFFKWPSRPK
jgi:CysZ protein